jgi:hypothetical protein
MVSSNEFFPLTVCFPAVIIFGRRKWHEARLLTTFLICTSVVYGVLDPYNTEKREFTGQARKSVDYPSPRGYDEPKLTFCSAMKYFSSSTRPCSP